MRKLVAALAASAFFGSIGYLVSDAMLLDSTICARARKTRDPRFDGRFFIGVLTTGIYCRPICPARSPKEENVRYFPTAAAAAEAGFGSSRCGREVVDIFFFGRTRRANGTAVNAGGQHADKETAVEARVSRLPGEGADGGVEQHGV